MLQHNILRYVTTTENSRDRTFYEVDWQQALHFLRAGRELWWVSQELSSEAAAVLKYISLNGKMKASDITSAFVPGQRKGQSEQARAFEKILSSLLEKNFIREASIHDTRPIEDLRQKIREEEQQQAQLGSVPVAKRVQEIELLVEKRLQSMLTGSRDVLGLKRKNSSQDHGRPHKRVKMDSSEGPHIDPETVLRVDHEKYLVHQRTEDLVNLCRRRLGPVPGAVYRFVLKLIEARIFSCQQDTSEFVVTSLQIIRVIPRDFDLSSIWAQQPTKQGQKSTKIRTKAKLSHSHDEDGDDVSSDGDLGTDQSEFVEEDEDAGMASEEEYMPDQIPMDGERIKMLNRFLELFVSDSLSLLRKVGTRSMGEWQVDFPHLVNILCELEIESTIQQKFGDLAPRLLRIIKDKVKVDEKALSTVALLKQKDIRHILTALHEIDVLDLQEVPKRLDRQPSMTYFLWGHNQERATATLSASILRAITRVQQRLQHELSRNSRLLDKSQRTDVRNRESEYLSKEELISLRRIRAVEEKMLAQSARLANSYSILAEYL